MNLMFLIVDSDDKLVEKLLALSFLVLILGIRFIKSLFEPQKNKQVNKYYTQKKLRVNNMFLTNVSRNEKDQQINEYVCILQNAFSETSIEQIEYNKTTKQFNKIELSYDYCISCNKIFPVMYENCPECQLPFKK